MTTTIEQRLNHAIDVRKIAKMVVLAHELKVDESAISRWRRGGTMSLANAAQLCVYLDVSLDWLILGRGGMVAHRDIAMGPGEADLILALRALPPGCAETLQRFVTIVNDHTLRQTWL